MVFIKALDNIKVKRDLHAYLTDMRKYSSLLGNTHFLCLFSRLLAAVPAHLPPLLLASNSPGQEEDNQNS